MKYLIINVAEVIDYISIEIKSSIMYNNNN